MWMTITTTSIFILSKQLFFVTKRKLKMSRFTLHKTVDQKLEYEIQ